MQMLQIDKLVDVCGSVLCAADDFKNRHQGQDCVIFAAHDLYMNLVLAKNYISVDSHTKKICFGGYPLYSATQADGFTFWIGIEKAFQFPYTS